MNSARVVVLDYGSGNVHSVANALKSAGADVQLTSDFQTALAADGLVIPGVGAFAAVMQQLGKVRAAELIDARLIAAKPVLAICVGLQVLFEKGYEHGQETTGLGQWPGSIVQLPAKVLPHIGWNTVTAGEGSALFEGIADERFYFVHSYAALEWLIDAAGPLTKPVVTWAEYGAPFVAAVENGPLVATQFHPEKSGEAGIALLRNWIRTFKN